MPSKFQIPIELLELIVENVDMPSSERRRTLVACSYVNRALSVMCQKRIFKDIQIRQKIDRVQNGITVFTEDPGTDGDRFLELITAQESHHIAAYVRNLAINVVDARPHNRRNTKFKPGACTSLDPKFPLYAITPLLPNLKKFAVLSAIGPTYTEWDTINQRIETFFCDLIQRLPEIDFRLFVDMLVSTVSNCPALEVLHISAFHTNETIPPSRAKLRYLDFGYNSPYPVKGDGVLLHFDSTYSPLDITHLTGLKLSSTVFFASDVDNILALCANTLESLELRVGSYGTSRFSYNSGSLMRRSNATPPNLSSLHNLRSLTLETLIDGYRNENGCYESNTLCIPAILQTLPHKMHSPFELVLDTFFQGFAVDLLPTFPWFELVNVLSGDRFSRCSTVVKFVFREWPSRRQDDNVLDASQFAEIMDRNDDLRKLGKKNICLVADMFY